jgi:hypothetical protein
MMAKLSQKKMSFIKTFPFLTHDTRWAGLLVIAGAILISLFLVSQVGNTTFQSEIRLPLQLTITERFGVSHPDQLVDFDLPGALRSGSYRMNGPNGKEVTYQLLSGNRVAVRVEGGLGANSVKTWTLSQGAPSAYSRSDEVRVTRVGGHYEITNGFTGVRIPAGGGPGHALAPIQGIRYRDGTWTATGPNILRDGNDVLAPKSIETSFIERGPLRVIVLIKYRINRPPLTYGGRQLVSGGEKFYISSLKIEAGQPSILIEEDTNMDLRYTLNIATDLSPNEARYQGGYSSSVANGRYADGRQYKAYADKINADAFVDLPFAIQEGSHRFLSRWDPWATDTGHYWQIYNRSAAAGANLFGVFQGPASRTIGAHYSGTEIYSKSNSDTGVVVRVSRRGPDARFALRNRFS